MLFTVLTVLELHAQSAAAPKLKSARILVGVAVVTSAGAGGTRADEDIRTIIDSIANTIERRLRPRVCKCKYRIFCSHCQHYNTFDFIFKAVTFYRTSFCL